MTPPETFGELLSVYMSERGITHREFAEKTGISSGHPANLISGKRTPPLQKIDKMATVLRLSAQQKQEFCEAAILAHARPELAALIATLRGKLAQAEEYNALIVKELRRTGVQLPKVSGER